MDLRLLGRPSGPGWAPQQARLIDGCDGPHVDTAARRRSSDLVREQAARHVNLRPEGREGVNERGSRGEAEEETS